MFYDNGWTPITLFKKQSKFTKKAEKISRNYKENKIRFQRNLKNFNKSINHKNGKTIRTFKFWKGKKK